MAARLHVRGLHEPHHFSMCPQRFFGIYGPIGFGSAPALRGGRAYPAAPKLSGDGGDKGIRTLDPLLAKQVLSQLSYTPIFFV